MDFSRTEIFYSVIALSIVTIAVTFICLAYALIKGSNSISNLIESIDAKVHKAIETLNNSIAEIGMVTNDFSKSSNEFVENLLQISQDAKTKVSEFNIPTPLRYEDFETGFQETLKFMELNGKEPNAPPNHVTPSGYSLWRWQEGQRSLFRKRKLEYEKIKHLEDIGFKWIS
ncbi:MAG: helicase associated domain-containing protein [bacterium]